MENRIALAPLTNLQSHPDGCLSEDEHCFLTYRALGGFGAVMTAAASVQATGRGFMGQLGAYDDRHLPGLSRLADAVQSEGSLAIVQLHHGGLRSPADLNGEPPVSASDHAKSGARALDTQEVQNLVESFISAAARVKLAGLDGIEVHGAHNYIIGQFLSADYNQRSDQYGGSFENRCRILFDIVSGIRARCGEPFLVAVRLTPERWGIPLREAVATAERLFDEQQIDSLEMSLWDVYKEPNEDDLKGRSLLSYFTDLHRGDCRLGVAGKIYSAKDIDYCLESGADFVQLGKAAILHHDFPQQMQRNSDFKLSDTPVSRGYLHNEGLGEAFIDYMSGWDGFVE